MRPTESLSAFYERRFQRRRKAALAAVHLPSELELLSGMPFFGDAIETDIREYALRYEQKLRRVKKPTISMESILAHVRELQINPSRDAIGHFDTLLRQCSEATDETFPDQRWRCRIYLASLGDELAALRLASDALTLTLGHAHQQGGPPLILRTVELLAQAASNPGFEFLAAGHRLNLARLGRMGQDYKEDLARKLAAAIGDEVEAAPVTRAVSAPAPPVLEKNEHTASAGRSGDALVVIPEVGASFTQEGKRVAREFAHVVGKPLPLVPVQDLDQVRETLLHEFPYAREVIHQVLLPLTEGRPVLIPPTVLFGPPGSGKSRFAGRLLTLLKIDYQVIPAGGMTDASPAGSSRHWTSGQSSLPVRLMAQKQRASVAFVLDEIDKAGTSTHNGRVQDALLAFLEPETARRIADPYLQAECDVSGTT